MAIKKFFINLHKLSKTYSPDEIVSGDIIVELSKPKQYQGIKLIIKGKGSVKWSEYCRQKERYISYDSNEKYFRKEVYVSENPDGRVVLSVGKHVFPFTFPVPVDIPSTFIHTIGKIEYSIKAIINVAWTSDPETTIPFIVDSGIDLNHYQCMPFTHTIEEQYYSCLWPCKQIGAVEAEVCIHKNAVASGDTIQVTIDLDHSTGSVRVTEFLLKFKQLINFYSDTRRVVKTEKNLLAASRYLGPFPLKAKVTMELTLPSIPSTSVGTSKLISISYYLQLLTEVSGCNKGSQILQDIIIGYKSGVPITIDLLPTAPAESTESLMPVSETELNNCTSYTIRPRHPVAGPSRASAPLDTPPPYESVIARQSKK